MIRNLILAISAFGLFLLLSMPVMAESTSSDKHDERNNIGTKPQPYSPPTTGAGMRNNPAVVNPSNPAMVNPSDPTGVNSNIPGSPGAPPGSVPSINPGSASSPGPTGGQ